MGRLDSAADQDGHTLITQDPYAIEFLLALKVEVRPSNHPVPSDRADSDAGRVLKTRSYLSAMMWDRHFHQLLPSVTTAISEFQQDWIFKNQPLTRRAVIRPKELQSRNPVSIPCKLDANEGKKPQVASRGGDREFWQGNRSRDVLQ
jgi:hypothetical protein